MREYFFKIFREKSSASVIGQMTQQEFQQLLRKYRENRCTDAERKIIDEWYTSIRSSGQAFASEDDERALKERTWIPVDDHIRRHEPRRYGSRTLFRVVTGVAATLLILILGWRYFEKSGVVPDFVASSGTATTAEKQIVNDGVTTMVYVLPDESRIHLNPGSKIRFAEKFSGNKREVYLEGEAFFEVARNVNRPFLVYTNDLTTEVLGTTFLIKAYEEAGQIVVTVKTGKVSVYTHSADGGDPGKPLQKIILSPNQEVVYNPGKHFALKKLVNEPQVILPTPTLKSSYTNAPVTQILSSLEENYGIHILYDKDVLANCTLTSDMSDEGFYEQIKIICNALGAQYKVEGASIVITATGCNPG